MVRVCTCEVKKNQVCDEPADCSLRKQSYIQDMGLLTLLGIAVGLGMDAFAVAIATGSRLERLTFRPTFRLSFHFGLFQFLMPIIGWYGGSRIEHLIRDYDHWIAFGLLLFIGINMIRESLSKDDDSAPLKDPTRKWTLILLSIATSIDALAVGLSMALLNVDILWASVIIGVVASGMTIVGMVFGRRLGIKFGKKMGFVGAAVLIFIGAKILVEHTMM